MKIQDLEKGTLVSLEDVIGDQTTIVAIFKGWTTGNSGHFPQMFFWDITAMAHGTKNAAPIVIDPMASMGKIIVLLTPKEYKEIAEKNDYVMLNIFTSLQVAPEQDKSRILSLPPSE